MLDPLRISLQRAGVADQVGRGLTFQVVPHQANGLITAKLAGQDLLQMLDPTVGPSATLAVSWWSGVRNADNGDLGRVTFVGMQTQGAAPIFFGGSPTYLNGSSGTSRFAEFVPGATTPPVTGSFDGGVATWTISKEAAGLGGEISPRSLFSVTATTMQGFPVYTHNSAMKQVDASPPFNYPSSPQLVTHQRKSPYQRTRAWDSCCLGRIYQRTPENRRG